MDKEKIIDLLCKNSNHGTRRNDIEAAYNVGVEIEREACAKLCESNCMRGIDDTKYNLACMETSKLIRMRSNVKLRYMR